jgi:hypothetical protein
MVCTTSVTKLFLKWTLRDAPGRILSKIVQYRSDRDLVKAWRQRSASQEEGTRRNLTVPVALSKTIQHILKECILSETRRHFLREVSPTLEERVLLGTARSIKAIEKFLA